MNINKLKEIVMKYVFLFTAIISIVAVVLICVFLFANGVPAMKEIGFANFLGGTKWKPGNGLYGIFPMILGSIYVTGGALIIGVPIGILMSIFMARFCPDRLHKVLKPIVDLLAGIPSIVQRQWTEHFDSSLVTWNHDITYNYQRVRVIHPSSGGELL